RTRPQNRKRLAFVLRIKQPIGRTDKSSNITNQQVFMPVRPASPRGAIAVRVRRKEILNARKNMVSAAAQFLCEVNERGVSSLLHHSLLTKTATAHRLQFVVLVERQAILAHHENKSGRVTGVICVHG